MRGMFGCQPTFSFQKLREHNVYVSAAENLASSFDTTERQAVAGGEADEQINKDVGDRQKEEASWVLGSVLLQ